MDMMEKDSSGIGTWGIVIFFLILFWIFTGNGYGLGNRGNCGTGCQVVSNCEVEKQGIIDSARTQFLIESRTAGTDALILAEANATKLAIMNDGNLTRNKIDFYAYESLKDQLAQSRAENIALKGQLYSDSKFNAIEMQLADIACNTPRRPPFYSAGGLPCATIYPTGCGSAVTGAV